MLESSDVGLTDILALVLRAGFDGLVDGSGAFSNSSSSSELSSVGAPAPSFTMSPLLRVPLPLGVAWYSLSSVGWTKR